METSFSRVNGFYSHLIPIWYDTGEVYFKVLQKPRLRMENKYGGSASPGFGGNVVAELRVRPEHRSIYGATSHPERFYAGCLRLSRWLRTGRRSRRRTC